MVSSADTLTRPRIAVALLSAFAAFSVLYYFHSHSHQARPAQPSSLHRRNAIRRPRRPNRLRSRSSSSSSTSDGEPAGDENESVASVASRPVTGDGETIAEASNAAEDWWNDSAGLTTIRAGQNIVSLLFRVSEDNARKNACVHRGCRCNACGTMPIRGLRYHCANCADFDLCETCESQGLHIKTHIFYKIRIPAKMAGTRSMQSVWYTGNPENTRRTLTKTLIARLSRETGLERPELEAHWEQWTFMANTEWRDDPDQLCLAMDRKTFERCLIASRALNSPSPNLIQDRIFSFYDTNNDGLIGFTEYLHGISYPHRKDKLRSIFNVYDVDGDGYVNRRDFLRLFRASYVLYKKMFGDLLEGMNNQRLGGKDAWQLISGRQPISSLFGREERAPEVETEPRLEGKMMNANGDMEIIDAFDRVVRPNRGDTSSREYVLSRITSHPTRCTDSYIRAILRTPNNVGQLPGIIAAYARDGAETEHRRFVDSFFDGLYIQADHDSTAIVDDEEGGNGEADSAPPSQPQPPLLSSGGHDLADDPAVQPRSDHAAHRHRAKMERRMLHDRWKRRQFYLDEEEGAVAPKDWGQDEDVLAASPNLGGDSESPKVAVVPKPAQTYPPRSRSSSKVRFVEDTDDFETRSNHSASSRSVPERWGGIDIPDAERDAGKEILYQVTQQACNELLDDLFKDKEDLALQAAATRLVRLRYKAVIDAYDPEKVAARKPTEIAAADHELATRHSDHGGPVGSEDGADADAEDDDDADGSADENDDGSDDDESSRDDENADDDDDDDEGSGSQDSSLAQDEDDDDDDENNADHDADHWETYSQSERSECPDALHHHHHSDLPDAEYTSAEDEKAGPVPQRPDVDGDDDITPTSPAPTFAPAPANNHSPLVVYRDPTMPQFRPNSEADCLPPYVAAEPQQPQGEALKEVLNDMLAEWKRIGQAEAEAATRGGWGRLSYDEFEALWRKQEMRGNKLDYLAGWIEFCIL